MIGRRRFFSLLWYALIVFSFSFFFFFFALWVSSDKLLIVRWLKRSSYPPQQGSALVQGTMGVAS